MSYLSVAVSLCYKKACVFVSGHGVSMLYVSVSL